MIGATPPAAFFISFFPRPQPSSSLFFRKDSVSRLLLSKHDVDGSENVSENVRVRVSVSAIIFQLFKDIMLEKCVPAIPELNWNQRLGHKRTKLNICHHMLTSSTQLQNRSFHFVEGTRTSSKCQKMKNTRTKRAKVLFYSVVVYYSNMLCLLYETSCCKNVSYYTRIHKCNLSDINFPYHPFFSITGVCTYISVCVDMHV